MNNTFKWIGVVMLAASLLIVGCFAIPRTAENERATVSDSLDAVRDGVDGMNELTDKADGETLPPAVPATPVEGAISVGVNALVPFVPQPYGGILQILGALIIPGFAWLRARGTAKQRQAEEEFLIRTLQEFKKEDPKGFKELMAMREKANAGLDTIDGLIQGIAMIKAGAGIG